MIKLNSSVYHRLLAQAEEAKERGLGKLSQGILGAIGAAPTEETVSYPYLQLQDDLYGGLWKLASQIIQHYNVGSVDAEKIDAVLESLAFKLLAEVEIALDMTYDDASLDEKVPGEE